MKLFDFLRGPKRVGFWGMFPELLDPRLSVDSAWSPTGRAMVLAHLRGGEVSNTYFGVARCRFDKCRKDLGCREYTDGVYVWPEGFVHYVEDHDVKPPLEFIHHVKSGRKP